LSSSPSRIDTIKLFAAALAPYGLRVDPIMAALAQAGETLQGSSRSALALLEAARLTNDPHFSLRLGDRVTLSDFGALGFAVMSCVNLREALDLLIRYHPLVGMGSEFSLTKEDRTTTLRARVPGATPDMRRVLIEAAFSSLAKAGCDLFGRPITEIDIRLSFPAPAYADQYVDCLYVPVEFDQAHCEIVFPNALLDKPIRTANPAGNVVFRQQCEDTLRTLNRVENVSARVRRVIMQAGRSDQDIARVARELAYSERTLRRRLAEEGTSFRGIQDEVRNILARNYLTQTQLTIADIADLLNYTEAASFRRAFKRLNGVTPQEFRNG